MVKKLAIFCGSNIGNSMIYKEAAETLADELSRAGLSIVYGGAKVGLMGLIADRMMANGSSVIGVIPQALFDVEIGHKQITQLHVVNSMQERKAMMSELADGFLMLPGGPGSLDEFFEVMTESQLGYHTKPYGILNTGGYYNGLLQFMDYAVEQGFMKKPHRDHILVEENPELLIQNILKHQVQIDTSWLKKAAG